jgi:histidinol-phosphate aminotransferase
VTQTLARANVLRLRPYVPGKPIEEVEREYGIRNAVKLASNENPLGPSPLAIEAIRAAAAEVALYPDGSCYALTRELAEHWGVAPENLILGNGSDEIIHYLGIAFLRPGDEVLTAHPSFVRYESAAILNEATCVAVSLRDYRYDLPAMAQRLSPRTRLVFIANPNNPTGTIVSRAELERFLDAVPPHAVVVMDEAYYEYVDSTDYPQCWEYVKEGRNLVILRTFSKIYGLAGLRVGYGMARPDLIHVLHQVREPFNVNLVAQAAARASLQDNNQVTRSRSVNRAGKGYLTEQLGRLGLMVVPSEANFVLVDLGRPGQAVFEALLRRGVIVRTLDLYGLPTHLRVTVGTLEENERFVGELRSVLADDPAGAAGRSASANGTG